MHHRKYGKLTVGAWLGLEMEQSHPAVMLAGGVLMTLGGILIRFFAGSPYMTVLALGIGDLVPPVWLMTVLWSLAFFTVGSAAGFVLGYRRGACEVDKYKGGMLFILLAVLEFCWYPTLFAGGLVFLSVLECILALCLSVGVTVCFYRVSGFAGMIFLLHDVWLIYMLILNFAVFFRA